MKTKHLVNIMMFGKVTSNDDIMLPFIFPNGIRINMKAYIKCLEEVILPWIERKAAWKPYIWL